MPYFFQFSQGENIRFPYRKRTFPQAETYVFQQGNIKNARSRFHLLHNVFLIHLSLFFLSASRQTTTHKLPEKAFEIQRIFPIFVHIIIHILTES